MPLFMRQPITLAAALAVSLAAPLGTLHAQQAAPVTIPTATGEAQITATPETVAIFDLAAVDTVHALGVDIAGIPNSLFLERLDAVADDATVVGTLFEPDFEALANLNPDLIIAGGRSSAQVEALSRLAPTLDMTITPEGFFDQVRARTAAYGEIFGKQAEADALLTQLDDKLATARAAVDGKGDALIILTNGGNISTYGQGTRFGWLHTALDLPQAVETLDATQTHGESVSFEFIAEADPDWLLVIDRGAAIGQAGEAARATLDNQLIAGTSAAKNDRIVYLDPAELYVAGGGVAAAMHTLDQITDAFGS
ncbi:MAG: siderophore ABC transporter substrate-binding protein [Celeribacter sp.]|jgi:iron complex transport system substrate-binding protein